MGTLLRNDGGPAIFGVTSRRDQYVSGLDAIPSWAEDILFFYRKKEDGRHFVFNPENILKDQSDGFICSTVRVLGELPSSIFFEQLPSSCIHWWRKPRVWTALIPKEAQRPLVVDLHNALKT